MARIKVISLCQPWAHLVVIGAKENETRGWSTEYRGDLYIHASKKFLFSDLELCHQDHYFRKFIPDPTKLVTGAILGKVKLTDIVRVESLDGKISKQERTFGDYRAGRFAWLLEDPVLFEKPIHTLGKLSIWEYDLQEEVSHG